MAYSLEKIGQRGRDLLTIVSLFGVVGIILVLVGDIQAVRNYFAEVSGNRELREDFQVFDANVQELQNSMASFERRYADVQQTLVVTTESLERTTKTIENITTKLESMEEQRTQAREPAITFEQSGHRISNAAPGGRVQVSFTIQKLRTCGQPRFDFRFRDAGGYLHSFRFITATDQFGRMEELPVRAFPQIIRFTAVIPEDEGVVPGDAAGWATFFDYSRCPEVEPMRSPDVAFIILEPTP